MTGNNPLPRDLKDNDFLLQLLEDMAKRWLAHDGLWFQEVEKNYGMKEAIRLDIAAWKDFSGIEAKRIMTLLGLTPNGGLPALKKALGVRLYAFVNKQEILETDEKHLVFRMNDCRVQSARKRKNLPAFPCKSIGLVEYETFAKTIDPRIKTRCIACPPDNHPSEYYCAWEFSI